MNLISGIADCGCQYGGEQSGEDFVAEDGRRTHFFFVAMSSHCPKGQSHGSDFGGTFKRFQLQVQPPELVKLVEIARDENPNLRLELRQPRSIIRYDVERDAEGTILGRWPL